MRLRPLVVRCVTVALLVASVLVVPLAGGVASSAARTPAAGQASTFVPVALKRIMNTSSRLGASAPAARGTARLKVTGQAGVPASGVTAVVLTLTVMRPAAGGYITAYADGAARPATSNVNFHPNQTIAVQVYAPVGGDGSVAFYNASAGSVQLVGDIAGYFTAAPARPGGAFVSTTPTRVLDTRRSFGAPTPAGRGTLRLAVRGAGPVPASGVSAVAINVTAASAPAAGYLSAYADGTARPPTSNLNFAKGSTVANLAIVPLGADGKIALYNGSAGRTPLVGDVVGYFRAGQVGATGTYQPVTPVRIADEVAKPRRNVDVIWDHVHFAHPAGEMVISASVVRPAATGYLAVSDNETASPGRPSAVSNLDFVAGQTIADLAAVPHGGGLGALYNGSSGTTRAIADLFGYYVAPPGDGTGAIAGTARDADSHAGVAGVRVHAYLGTANDDGDEGGSTITAADGTYRIDRLPINTPYIVCFDAAQVTAAGDPYAGYPSQCYKDLPWNGSGMFFPVDAPQVITEAGGTVPGVDATLQKRATGSITGIVTGAGGAGIAGVLVDPGLVSAPSVKTALDGSFTVPGVPAGTYRVCFSVDGVTDANGPDGYVRGCHTDATVASGQTVTVNQQLTAAGRVAGRFTTSTGAPIKSGVVEVRDDAGTDIVGADLGVDGSYAFSGLQPGVYHVCAFSFASANPPFGFVNHCVDNVHVTPAMTVMVSAVLAEGGAIAGTLTTQSGTAVSGAEVLVIDGDGRNVQEGATGSDGTFRVPAIPAAAHEYAVCFTGSLSGTSGPVPFNTCYHDQPWSGPSQAPIAVPAGVTRVSVTSGSTTGSIDQKVAAP